MLGEFDQVNFPTAMFSINYHTFQYPAVSCIPYYL